MLVRPWSVCVCVTLGTARFLDSSGWRRWLSALGILSICPSHTGVFQAPVWSRCSRAHELRSRCSHHSSLCWHCFPCLFPQIPSFLLCYAFSSQRSFQSVAENDYKLCIVLSFIVITCMFLFFFFFFKADPHLSRVKVQDRIHIFHFFYFVERL